MKTITSNFEKVRSFKKFDIKIFPAADRETANLATAKIFFRALCANS